MESRKMALMKLFATETDTGHRLMDTGWGEGEGEIYGESNMET